MALTEAEIAEVTALIAANSAPAGSVDAFYLLYAGALVFLMQAGFAMLCAGSVRMKNAKNMCAALCRAPRAAWTDDAQPLSSFLSSSLRLPRARRASSSPAGTPACSRMCLTRASARSASGRPVRCAAVARSSARCSSCHVPAFRAPRCAGLAPSRSVTSTPSARARAPSGYGVAYGSKPGNWFCGTHFFFLNGIEHLDSYHSWMFQFAFAATAATIVSGAVAERCQMAAYAGYSALLTMWVYPVVVHWIWSSDGWLSAFSSDPMLGIGVVDFAGCGVVHMVGGAAALAGATVLGPRIGRFEAGKVNPMPGHNASLVVLGTFILWFGWYGFNPGSTLGITASGYAFVAAKTATTTTLSAASGAVTNLIIALRLSGAEHVYDLEETCNGALAGLVGITSACSVVDPWASLLIGAIAAFAYQGGRVLLLRLKIDDVVNAAPVHLFAGMWGLLAPAFFASPVNMANAYGVAKSTMLRGIFYGGNAKMLGMQLLALVMVCVWTFAWMFPFFIMMSKLGLFRVPADMEEEGLDVSKHGGVAYPGIDGSFTGIQVGDGGKPSSVAPTIGLVPQAKPADDGTADA